MAKRKRQIKPNKESAPRHEDSVEHGMERDVEFEFDAKEPRVATDDAPHYETDEMDQLWLWGSRGILIVAALLRFAALTFKPFHHDEGVNGFFLTGLFRDGVYKYDPTNYHGPSLYYFALLSSWIFGLDDLAVRVVVAVFGFLTVALVFRLRRYLGTIGTLVAAALVALSPGLTFFSRYFIHEILLVFFTFACAICVLKFIEGERISKIAVGAMSILLFTCVLPVGLRVAAAISPAEDQSQLYVTRFIFVLAVAGIVFVLMRRLTAWDEGRPIYLLLAAASASMTFTTKETSFISLGTMLIAIGSVGAWVRFAGDKERNSKNVRSGFILAALGLVVVAIYFGSDLAGGIGWYYATYITDADKREQPLVFMAIIILFVATAESARRYLTENWKGTVTSATWSEPAPVTFSQLRRRVDASGNAFGLIFLSILTFTGVALVFFSSFFTYEKGVGAAFEAYNVWSKTGSSDHAQNGMWAYLKWLIGAEAPILILALLGTVTAFWQGKHRFAMFTALWGFGLFGAYTIIPYKTPWIAINFVLPMALTAGYAINELASGKEWWNQYAAKGLSGLALAVCLYQCIELNFVRYDDDRRPYVYVHSMRSMNEMMREIENVAKRAKTGDKAKIIIASPENWPLPWTLNQYKAAAFFGSVVKIPDAEVVIGSKPQRSDLDREYGATHVVTGTYTLRPGVELLLYVRKDIVEN
jgi:uncharacterized protein (TIGR03663 family)